MNNHLCGLTARESARSQPLRIFLNSGTTAAERTGNFSAIRHIFDPTTTAGAGAAKGDVFAYTDSDCMVDPDWLYYLLSTLLSGNYAGVGGPNVSPPARNWVQACVAAREVEALEDSLSKIDVGDEVTLRVIDRGVGAITETNVDLAAASDAIIIGFNVRPDRNAADVAEREQVDIRLHSIIYKVEEEIRAAMIGMLEAIEKERIIGKADVREIFRVPKAGVVAGSMVVDGNIRRNARARLIRDGVVSWEGNIASLLRQSGLPVTLVEVTDAVDDPRFWMMNGVW